MEIHKARYNQAIPVIRDGIASKPEGKGLINAFDISVLADSITSSADFKFLRTFAVNDISLQYKY